MPTPSLITHVSDTARWVAFYRAMESERPDAIFRDPFARRLAGERGEAIVRTMKHGRRMAWPMIVRTAVMDEIILRLIAAGVDCVLNLAAGLDARPWRLALPATLRWVDVDHPEMIDYKERELADSPPACAYQGVPLDLSDGPSRRALFERIGGSVERALVITEGLLVYLPSDSVAELARDLHTQTAFRYWLTDLASPRLLKMIQKNWGAAVQAGNAPFIFAPAESTAFFAPFGWREAEFRPTFDESIRLKRTLTLAWLWRLLGKLSSPRKREEFKRFSGIVLMERT